MTGPDANTQDTRTAVTTHLLLGIAGVLLGALIATYTGRLMSVGLADIRGGLYLGVYVGSWIDTTFNASMMFIAPYSRFLGLQHAFGSHSTGFTAVDRAAEVLGLQVRQQAYAGNLRQLSPSGYMLRGVPRGGFLHVQSANSISAGHCCTSRGQMRSTLHERGQIMTSAFAARRG